MAMDYKFKEFPGRVITTSDINFNCNQGSVLRGSLTISCGYDGLWTINPPICGTW